MSVRKWNNTWQIRLQAGGKRYEKSLTPFATRKDALDYEAKIRRDIISGKIGKSKTHTIEDALSRWLQGEASTLKSYKNLLTKVRQIVPFITDTPLTAIVDAAEEIKQDGIKSGKKAATINRRLSILKRLANLAYNQWDWLDKPLAQKIKKLPGEEKRHIYLTPDQVETLADHCKHPIVAIAIRLIARTGLRRSEVIKADTIFDGCIVVAGKGNPPKQRLVPVPNDMPELTLPLGISVNELRNYFDEARILAGLPHVRIHDLRHTAASWWAQSNANLSTIRELLGHADLSTTGRYAHLSTEHLKLATTEATRQRSGSKLGLDKNND
tara:strand:- start:6260 stop:7237 length:978 start_codon:yes stop_codon:yes gene_type:complete